MDPNTALTNLVGGDIEDVFDYSAGPGGDTGRGELPNIPGQVESSQDYQSLMEPASQVYSSDEVNAYGSKMLGVPPAAPPVHQLSVLANQYTPENEMVNSDKGRQFGAGLIRRQMNESKDKNWMSEPIYGDYIKSIGLDQGRPDSWNDQLKKMYGI